MFSDFFTLTLGMLHDGYAHTKIGIRRIQEVAVPMFHMLRLGKGYEEFTNPIWTVDENVEILTRVGVRDQMPSIFAGELSGDTVEELSDVLFNVVYPTYARNPKE